MALLYTSKSFSAKMLLFKEPIFCNRKIPFFVFSVDIHNFVKIKSTLFYITFLNNSP